jgi:hypothetical protein
VRPKLVVLLVVLGACESRFGAYLTVQGAVELDEVELYFGAAVDTPVLPGNAFASPTFGPQMGTIFDRTYDASDVVMMRATTQTTFYLPPDERNQKLGAYVAAVAIAGGKPVGIAEYFDFKIPSDAVHEYILELAPWDPSRMERWGDRPGCVTWKHDRKDRDPIVAVVHDDDRDCDALASAMDCSDVCHAQSPACSVDRMFCGVTGTCALGCTRSGICAPSLCLPPTACTSLCSGQPSIIDRVACGAANTNDHIEIYVERTDQKLMCVNQFQFKPGVPCTAPIVEATDEVQPGVTWSVAQTSGDPASCTLMISPPGSLLENVLQHALISVAPMTVGPRVTFVVGVSAESATPQTCNVQPLSRVTMPTTPQIYDCR